MRGQDCFAGEVEDGGRPVGVGVDPTARRLSELVAPIDVILFSADEPNEALFALVQS